VVDGEFANIVESTGTWANASVDDGDAEVSGTDTVAAVTNGECADIVGSTERWITVTNTLSDLIGETALVSDEDDATDDEGGDESSDDIIVDSDRVSMRKPDIITVDLRDLLDSGDVRLNVPIYGSDIVSIPPRRQDFVYVLGYVQRPGSFELRGKKEVEALQAVAMAGGLSMAARAQNTVLIREEGYGREVISVDLTKIARGSRPPVYMQAGDTLIVGSGFFAKLAEFIRPSVSAGASLTPGL